MDPAGRPEEPKTTRTWRREAHIVATATAAARRRNFRHSVRARSSPDDDAACTVAQTRRSSMFPRKGLAGFGEREMLSVRENGAHGWGESSVIVTY